MCNGASFISCWHTGWCMFNLFIGKTAICNIIRYLQRLLCLAQIRLLWVAKARSISLVRLSVFLGDAADQTHTDWLSGCAAECTEGVLSLPSGYNCCRWVEWMCFRMQSAYGVSRRDVIDTDWLSECASECTEGVLSLPSGCNCYRLVERMCFRTHRRRIESPIGL